MSVDQEKVIVTGAALGLGQAVADAFLAQGAQVAGIDVLDGVLREGSPELRSGAWHGRVLDLTDGPASREAARWGIEALGGVTTLVNVVGGMRSRETGVRYLAPALELTDEQIDDTFGLTLRSPLVCSIEAAKWMIEHDAPGSIVNIGSDFGERPAPTRLPYGFCKAGITSITHSMAAEWGQYGIRINEIVPYVKTESMRAGMEDPVRGPQMMRKIALRRFAEPDEIVPAILFLASKEASYINGARLHVDGGHIF